MQAVENALDAALLVLRSGGSTVAAERSFNNILAGYGRTGITPIWRLDFIAANFVADGRPATLVRTVGAIGVNLSRASAVADLSEQVAEGRIPVAAVSSELQRVRSLASPYPRTLAVLAAACIGASLSQVAGGDYGSLWVAALAAAAGQLLRLGLQAKNVPAANVLLICGALSQCIAALALRLGASQLVPVTLIASVVYLAPGLPLINGFVDMASHRFLLIGAERISHALFLFLVLAIATALATAIIM